MKFVDFFSGAGMFRMGMEKAGHECVGYVEFEKNARKTYEHNFNTENEWTEWDVKNVKAEEIPESDIWCFGFPCVGFSTANAVSRYGLRSEKSGLFLNMIGLLEEVKKKPKHLFIENVKGFTTLNGGIDFLYALTLLHKLGYDIRYEISSAVDYGVPQNRIRTYLTCTLNDQVYTQGRKVEIVKKNLDVSGINIYELHDYIEANGTKVKLQWGKVGYIRNETARIVGYEVHKELTENLSDYLEVEVEEKVYLNDEQLTKVQRMKGSKEKLLPDGRIWKEGAVPFPDLTDRRARCVTPSDGSLNRSTHIIKDNKGLRKLSLRERARLQKLPDTFEFPVSDSQASLQLGNGVCVEVITEIAKRELK